MNQNEKQDLEIELELLKELLKFHAERWSKLSMSETETENHINDILDRINEINVALKII